MVENSPIRGSGVHCALRLKAPTVQNVQYLQYNHCRQGARTSSAVAQRVFSEERILRSAAHLARAAWTSGTMLGTSED